MNWDTFVIWIQKIKIRKIKIKCSHCQSRSSKILPMQLSKSSVICILKIIRRLRTFENLHQTVQISFWAHFKRKILIIESSSDISRCIRATFKLLKWMLCSRAMHSLRLSNDNFWIFGISLLKKLRTFDGCFTVIVSICGKFY